MLAINGGTPVKTTKNAPWPQVNEFDRELLATAVSAGNYRSGALRSQFESIFAADCGAEHCFAVANGTVSLELILRAMGIGLGDEVILPPYTFVATLSSIVFTGATPVFADIDGGTYNISPEGAEAKITDKTRAIVAVAIGGCPPDLDGLEAVAKKHGVRLIVDAAQGVGAVWKGRSICTYGDAASISCQNTKNLTCGEGGIITTNDDELADRISIMLNGGTVDGRYVSIAQDHSMTEFQAALLLSQYDKLDGEVVLRDKNAAYLSGRLRDLDFINSARYDERITRHAYHIYVMMYNSELLAEKGVTREQLRLAMKAEGVAIAHGYSPLYTFPCVTSPDTERMIGGKIDTSPLPVCERASYREGAWIMQNALLGTRADMDAIADAFIKVWEHVDDVRKI